MLLGFMLLGFIELKDLFLIIHLFGVVVGMGGAFVSGQMFFSSVQDRRISDTELRFLELGAKMVWIGLSVLVISGAVLFSLDTDKYLDSSKFLAKITIVAILTVNGFLFHVSHLPRIARHTGEHLPSSDEFMRRKHFLLFNGAVSISSWSSALILGALKTVPYAYWQIMLVYGAVVVLAVGVSLILIGRKVLPSNEMT